AFQGLRRGWSSAVAWWVEDAQAPLCAPSDPGGWIELGEPSARIEVEARAGADAAACHLFPGAGGDVVLHLHGFDDWEGGLAVTTLVDEESGIALGWRAKRVEDGAAVVSWPAAAAPDRAWRASVLLSH